MEANETTIYYIQEDDALEGSGYMIAQPDLSTNQVVESDQTSNHQNASLLLPQNLVSQNSILGKDFVIRCSPCNKIFVSAEGYNSHVQV